MTRREWTAGLAALGLSGCATQTAKVSTPLAPRKLTLNPIHARMDRVFRITVCSRPFRAAGPRIEAEKLGEKVVVHNYGHGGSGWSLSWGSSSIATDLAMGTGEKQVAVVGCGALGLTSAILLQRAGAKVTIYAKERPPEVRSARATGSWTPDSRVALTSKTDANFPALWEKMARYSWRMYESFLGIAGNPIEWVDNYQLSDEDYSKPQPQSAQREAEPGLDFGRYSNRIADLRMRRDQLGPGQHPFRAKYAYRAPSLTFNVAGYSRQLVQDFLIEGGRIERREFQSINDLQQLPEKTIVNATGFGARQLLGDNSVVPVRGQITWLIPQPEVHYGVMYNGVYILSRRDGIVVQGVGSGEMEGYNNADETPDRKEAEATVQTAAEAFAGM